MRPSRRPDACTCLWNEGY